MAWRTPSWLIPWKVVVWHLVWWYGGQENLFPVSQTGIWPNWWQGPAVLSTLALVVHVLFVLWISWPPGCHRSRWKWSPGLEGLYPSVLKMFVPRSCGQNACVGTPIDRTGWLQPSCGYRLFAHGSILEKILAPARLAVKSCICRNG